MPNTRQVPLDYRECSLSEMAERAAGYAREVARRRSVRDFSARPASRAVIEDCLRAAGSAPSGANMPPWHFGVVSDLAVKRGVRQAPDIQRKTLDEIATFI